VTHLVNSVGEFALVREAQGNREREGQDLGEGEGFLPNPKPKAGPKRGQKAKTGETSETVAEAQQESCAKKDREPSATRPDEFSAARETS
jgi:hypothetical protein